MPDRSIGRDDLEGIRVQHFGNLAPDLAWNTAVSFATTTVAAVVPAGLATLSNAGPHGFSEILYAFTSSAASNGSAMAGLGPNTLYDVLTGLTNKPRNALTRATLQTDTPLFAVLILANVIVVGALTFLPDDALGPIVDHILLQAGKTF